MEENTDVIFVIDTSYVMSFLMPDEQSAQAVSLFFSFSKKQVILLTTTLLPYEVTNSLRTNVLRKRISSTMACNLIARFSQLNIPKLSPDIEQVIKISLDNHISCYDASYIALAREKKAQLLTFDDRLKGLV